MAESDQKFEAPIEEAPMPVRSGSGRWRRVVLMASLPLLLIAGAFAYYKSTENFVSTDNAYVQQDKVSVSAQVSGEIVEVWPRPMRQSRRHRSR